MIEEVIQKEFSKPSYAVYEEDLVTDYLFMESRCGKLYRYIGSDEFILLDPETRRLHEKHLEVLQDLLKIIGEKARKAGCWPEIVNLMQ